MGRIPKRVEDKLERLGVATDGARDQFPAGS